MTRIIVSLRDQISASVGGPFLRFFLASLLGLCFDVALASTLHHVFNFSLIGAAAIALLVAATMMYFVHEFWTFRLAAGQISLARMGGTVASALVALAVRSACLYSSAELLELGGRLATPQLVAATGVSFVLNYFLVRRIIDRRASA